jgi:hypothetical protein
MIALDPRTIAMIHGVRFSTWESGSFHSSSQLIKLSFKHLVEAQLVLDSGGDTIHLCLNGLHRFVVGGQLLF